MPYNKLTHTTCIYFIGIVIACFSVSHMTQGKEDPLKKLNTKQGGSHYSIQQCKINVKDYGAVGDGNTDDHLAINNAILAAANHDNSILYFPCAVGYLASITIKVPPDISVQMDAPLIYAGPKSTSALVVGDKCCSNLNRRHRLNVIQSIKQSGDYDWSSEEFIGILLYNAVSCRINIVQVDGFTIGVQAMGSGKGFSYNDLRLGQLSNSKILLDLTNENDGFCNENLFLNGRFTAWSATQAGEGRYGIRITSKDETYLSNNNNYFIKPSFELVAGTAHPGEAIPILVEHGEKNEFKSCRDEGNSPVFARLLNGSIENEFHLGLGTIYPVIDDQSENPTSIITSRRSRLITTAENIIFMSGPLHKKAGYYDSFRVHIPGVHLTEVSALVTNMADGIAEALSGINITDNHLELLGSRGIGVFTDTSIYKRFVVRTSVEDGYGGRIWVRCYDENGQVLQDLNSTPAYVTGTVFRQFQFTPDAYGGAYSTGSDSVDDLFFRVTDDVKKVDIFLTGGSAALRLRGFNIYSVDGGAPAVWTGLEEGISGANLAEVIPSTGIWQKGRIVYNGDPDPSEALGWICTEGGAPGVWKTIGFIEN